VRPAVAAIERGRLDVAGLLTMAHAKLLIDLGRSFGAEKSQRAELAEEARIVVMKTAPET